MTARRRHRLAATALVVIGALGCWACKGKLGEKENPVKVQIVPSRNVEQAKAAGQKLVDHLAGQTGLKFTLEVPKRYIDLVVAIGDEKADLAFMNDMSYLLAHKEYGAQALLAVHRGDREKSYRAIIIVRSDSGITKLSELENKRIAYVDVHSVSGYIMPAMLLKSKNVKPAGIIKAGSHEEVVRLVYHKKAEAGFTYFDAPADATGKPRDARSRVASELPDVYGQVKILAQTEKIPNEPIVFGKHVPKQVREQIVKAMEAYIETAEGKRVFMEFNEITGLHRVFDADYDPIRKALAGLGQTLDEMVPGGGILQIKRQEGVESIPPLGN